MSFGSMNLIEKEIKNQIQELTNLFEQTVAQGEITRSTMEGNDFNILILRTYDMRAAKELGDCFFATLQNYRNSIDTARDQVSVSINLQRQRAGAQESQLVIIQDAAEMKTYLESVQTNERVSTMDVIHDIVREHVHIRKICKNPQGYHARAIDLPKLDDSVLDELQAFAEAMALLPPKLQRIAAEENRLALRHYAHMYNITRKLTRHHLVRSA